jgi:arabinose-5-phosphate isomerase
MNYAKELIAKSIDALILLKNNIPSEFESVVELIVNLKGRVIVSGMGKSGIIGKKFAASLSSTGTPAYFLHPGEASHGDMGQLTKEDVVFLISNSGNTKELSNLISYSLRFGITIVGISMQLDSELMNNSNYKLLLPRFEEASSVNAPTISTTMTLVLCDALMVAIHESKGFTKDLFKILHPGGKIGASLTPIKEIMHFNNLPIVQHDTLMKDALIVMSSSGFGMLIVTDFDNKVIGIITDGDLRRHMGDNFLNLQVKEVMTQNPICVNDNIKTIEALKIMEDNKITSLIITKDNCVIGLLNIHDILKMGVK